MLLGLFWYMKLHDIHQSDLGYTGSLLELILKNSRIQGHQTNKNLVLTDLRTFISQILRLFNPLNDEKYCYKSDIST